MTISIVTKQSPLDNISTIDTLARALQDNCTIEKCLRLHKSTGGLDKLLRTIQFFARLLAFQTSSTGLMALKKQFSISRRAIKLTNNMTTFKAMLKSFKTEEESVLLKALGCIKDAGSFAHGFLDSVLYFHDAKIAKMPRHLTTMLNKMAFIFWGSALVSTALGGFVKLVLIDRALKNIAVREAQDAVKDIKIDDIFNVQPLKKTNPEFRFINAPPTPPMSPVDAPFRPPPPATPAPGESEDQKRLEKQRKEVALAILGASSDALFPAAGLHVPGFSWVGEGVLSVAGCVSSVVGLRSVWNAIA